MQMRFVGCCSSSLLVLLLLVAGCDSRPKCVPVSGKVLIDGEPLKYGGILFVPAAGRQSTGVIDVNGQFKLTCFQPDDGAIIGMHSIRVCASEALNNTTMKWHAPIKYAEIQTSGLTQEITGPTDSVVIELTWKGSTPDKPFTERSEADAGEEAFGKSRRKKVDADAK
jgi:hypothetical protein